MTNDKGYVVFEDSLGNEISNDPRWHAERILGLSEGQSAGVGMTDAERAELEELREFKRTHGVAQAPQDPAFSGESTEDDEDDDDEDEEVPYAEVKGDALVALAKERNITLRREDGSKLKAGEVRAALAAQDEANAAAAQQ